VLDLVVQAAHREVCEPPSSDIARHQDLPAQKACYAGGGKATQIITNAVAVPIVRHQYQARRRANRPASCTLRETSA
jgi:hypothetical protein